MLFDNQGLRLKITSDVLQFLRRAFHATFQRFLLCARLVHVQSHGLEPLLYHLQIDNFDVNMEIVPELVDLILSPWAKRPLHLLPSVLELAVGFSCPQTPVKLLDLLAELF